MKERFTNNGSWIYPKDSSSETAQSSDSYEPFIATTAYCPKGCNLLNSEHTFQGTNGIHLKFKVQGQEGEMVISAIEGDHSVLRLYGECANGERIDLYCPHCDVALEKLVDCHCTEHASMVFIGATPKLDFTRGVALCNVCGCHEGVVVAKNAVRRLHLSTPDFPH